jgi:type IV conjugative transfer system coupling protein TraD
VKHEFTNFTRGSQLIGHFGFMFAAGLKGPLIVTTLVFTGLIWWELRTTLSSHESYLCWMRLWADIYNWFEFDPTKILSIETAGGNHLLVPIVSLAEHPLVASAWVKLRLAVSAGMGLATLITVPAVVAFAWVAAKFGKHSKSSRHERGAMLADLPALVAEIEAHNAEQRGREYRRVLGPNWRFATRAECRAAGLYEPYRIAGVPYPWRLEQSHAMLIGTTGTGKTVAMRELLGQIRERGHRAVVFDLTGAFIEAFYRAETDVILNPMDARSPQWSIFEDCTDEAELTAAAEALIPHDGGGSEQFWVLAARMLFVEMCLKLMKDDRATNQALADELMTASLAHVHKLMEGTIADPLTAPEAARMAESIRAVFNANAKALKMLPTSGKRFSVKEWVHGASCLPGAILFVSARYVDLSIASRLLTVWMDTAMNTLMTLDRTSELRLWFLFDELGALHRLPAIEKGLQTARNYGGAIVAGVHAYAKLKETYGENMAMTLSSLARTKLVLATADRESATWCSDFIGHRQYREMEEGYSYGYNNARDAVSLTPRRQIEPLLLPDQLMNLQRLQGYLKFPDGFPAAPIRLSFVDYPLLAEGFIPRAKGTPPVPSDQASSSAARRHDRAAASGDDQGPGHSGEAKEPSSPITSGADNLFSYAARQAEGAPLDVRSPSSPLLPPKPRIEGSAGQLVREKSRRNDRSRRTGEDPRSGRTGATRSDLAPPSGAPRAVDPSRSVRPLTRDENVSLRELKSGVAPGDAPARDDRDIEL